MAMRVWVVIGLVAVLGAVGADASPTPSPNVRGTLMRGPVVPVCVEGKACDAPAPGVALVFSRDGAIVKRVTTGLGGRFALRLRAGVYDVRTLRTPSLGNVLRPTRFRVPRLGVATLRLHLDSGIR